MASCHVIKMPYSDCVLTGTFKVGPQKLAAGNSTQPLFSAKKIGKQLTHSLSMGV